MTREEAIEILKTSTMKDTLSDRWKEAYKMAIKALSQEPCQLLIIKSDILLHQDDRKKWMDSIKREKENGVIILPPYFTPLLVPNDVEIRIEQPCDDAISREAVLKKQYRIDDSATLSTRDVVNVDDIEDEPSVTQKSKYWIDKDNKIYKMPDDIPTMTIQYPTITHGDTISRTEVMKVISDFVTFEKYIDKHNHITFEPLEKMINALSSVTQKSGKSKTGHWILTKDGFECMECGCISRSQADFCQYCGAKMVEPRESEG